MGWHNPPIPWPELEQRLVGAPRRGAAKPGDDAQKVDSPAWSYKRPAYVPIEQPPSPADRVPYAELHAHSNFSFLDGASKPEELLEEATRLGLDALALTDHDGLYGIVRMAEAAENYDIAMVFGAELSLGLSAPQNGVSDPEGQHLVVLARREEGYHRLAGALTAAQLAGGEKGRPVYDLEDLAERAGGHWLVLSGCRKGAVRSALASEGRAAAGQTAAARELDRLVELFGRENVAVELIDHNYPLDSTHNDVLAALAESTGLTTIATGNVHYATPDRHRLATALAAVRAHRSLDEMDGWLPASGSAHLRSGAEMAARFARYPGAVERTVDIARDLSFELRKARPGLPRQEVPPGHTPMTWLRELVWQGAAVRYPGELPAEKRDRLERELVVIEEKDFPGYFLIVHDIVEFARSKGILCQGRGSAANSAVCYVLNITAVDAIHYRLPFERFLSSMREEEPDIDVDFDSDRREEVIQYVFEKYGRLNAAQVATVISYRPQNAVRDMAKALGASPGQQDAWSKQVQRWDAVTSAVDHDIPAPVLGLAGELLGFPRHLGIHSGGMVLTDRPVGEVSPIEHARMENRTVLQWDKDDCAWMGLVKFDLLGLGMLAALQHCFDLVHGSTGERWTLATIPPDEQGVYDMLCRADAIGVFQVESRAQMSVLPRLQPREFYDLVVEIALIRPGPIQGGAVHPFIRRKVDGEPFGYVHPSLEPILERTMGIPLFQEQAMQMAAALGDLGPDDAERLRRAIGSKRGAERFANLKDRLFAGMTAKGITGDTAEGLYEQIKAFANFGFAESHSLSFALLVYASAWFKLHYPAAFLAALLRAQPMGFYSSATLTADARRHGVEVRRPDILLSGVLAELELREGQTAEPTGDAACAEHEQPPIPRIFDRAQPRDDERHRRDAAFAVRLGLDTVKGIGTPVAAKIVAEREHGGPYRSMPELVRRTGLTVTQLEALAAADAFASLGLGRREALWLAGSAANDRPEYLPGTALTVQPPLFPLPSALDGMLSDLWATGISPDDHPVRHVRHELDARGVLAASALATTETGRRIEVGGIVTHRQRPGTASGITFLNLEDETGLVNVICTVGVWARYRRIARDSRALLVRGILERSAEGVTNVLVDRFENLPVPGRSVSRDFR